jgi:Glycosyl hydrolase family 99
VSRLILAGALALAALTPAPAATANPDHLVLAYYYSQWDPNTFSVPLFQPDEAYNSDDGAVMERHVRQAQAAGIDAFVVMWLGDGDRTDRNLARLLDLSQRSGFRATIHFDTPLFWGVDDTIAQLRALYEHRLNHPAMLRYGDRPVIFIWRVSTYDNATWSGIRNQVDPEHRAVWIADGDQIGVVGGDAWDGISPYAIAWSANPIGQLGRWATTVQAVAPDKLWIPPVSPGCNDAAVRAPTCLQDRRDGQYYQATWDGALASNPSWAVIVSTFNEWMESTQIEPSVQYGDQYLGLTRQYADAFHAAP